MTIFFTSDTHFYHKAIIQYCNRPVILDESGEVGTLDKYKGSLVEAAVAMNELLIRNWNSKVKPDDEVWHLGDFAFCGWTKFIPILERLNGRKNWVLGNHDYGLFKKEEVRKHFEFVGDYKRLMIHDSYEGNEGEIQQYHQPIILCHFPILSWDGMAHGSWHLHGHCHGSLPDTGGLRMDVGVDPMGYFPVSFEELKNKMALRTVVPSGDHHKPK